MISALFTTVLSSERGVWVWEGGPSTTPGAGALVAAAASAAAAAAPRARCCAQTWATDDALFMLGGAGDVDFFADLWRMELPTRPDTLPAWKRVGGGSAPDNFGGNATLPAARTYAVTWVAAAATAGHDNSSSSSRKQQHELWMWGGQGSAYDGDVDGTFLDDMWSFDVKSGAWARQPGGSGPPRPGKHEVPTARQWANFWPDSGAASGGGGGVWMHGGSGAPTPQQYYENPLSDMWYFDNAARRWTQIYNHTGDTGAVYDGPGRHPGARSNSYTASRSAGAAASAASSSSSSSSSSKPDGGNDDDGDTLWLFGGEGSLSAGPNGTRPHGGGFQDVWTFDAAAARRRISAAAADGAAAGQQQQAVSEPKPLWRHVSGPKTVRGAPNYGVRGVASASNLPPSEHAGPVFRQALDDSLWFFGGEDGREAGGMRGDLWSLNLTTVQWTWQSGAPRFNSSAHYGQVGVPAAANVPGARYASQAWVAQGMLWLFGGYGIDRDSAAGYLGDLWTFRL